MEVKKGILREMMRTNADQKIDSKDAMAMLCIKLS